MQKYLLVEGTAQDEEGNTVNCDGIAAPSGFIVEDVSLDRERLARFIQLLNDGEAEECQLMDLIEDFVNGERMI